MYELLVALALTAAAVALLLIGGVTLAAAGLRLPDRDGLGRWAGVLTGAGLGSVLTAVALRTGRLPVSRLVGDIDVLLPWTRRERCWFAGVALTAGVTEEVVYRGFALTVLLALLPGTWPALLVAAAAFGLGHAYQGRVAMLLTGVLAVVLGRLYLDTGSLFPGTVVHVAIDLRVLLLRPPADPTREPVAQPVSGEVVREPGDPDDGRVMQPRRDR